MFGPNAKIELALDGLICQRSQFGIRLRSAMNVELTISGRTWTSLICGVHLARTVFCLAGGRLNFTYPRQRHGVGSRGQDLMIGANENIVRL